MVRNGSEGRTLWEVQTRGKIRATGVQPVKAQQPDRYCQADVTFSHDNLSHQEQTEPMPQQYSDLRV